MQEKWQRIATETRRRRAREIVFLAIAVCATVLSAIAAKEAGVGPALVAIDREAMPAPQQRENLPKPVNEPEIIPANLATPEPAQPIDTAPPPVKRSGFWTAEDGTEYFTPEPGHQRYFRGRPIRPARTIWMTVTAYSPDHRSCGRWADGITASLKSVWTNGMELVAADTRLLPMGTLVSVPGYADGRTVPVLDRGGAIKGARLDVLYPTHSIARKWGVQRLPVIVWEYADED